MTSRQSVATMLRSVAAAMIVHCQPGGAQAADLKVLTFLSSKPILTDVAPEFEGSTRHKLSVTYGSIEPLRDRVSAGEIADVMISSRVMLDDLTRPRQADPQRHYGFGSYYDTAIRTKRRTEPRHCFGGCAQTCAVGCAIRRFHQPGQRSIGGAQLRRRAQAHGYLRSGSRQSEDYTWIGG